MHRARLCNLAIFAAILCIALGSFLGCSQQKRYELLTFFFDGVPAPAGVDTGGAQLVSHLHKPYADGQCASCHGTDDMEMSIGRAVTIAEISSNVCLKCHEKVRASYPVMHGPVAAAECLICHAPHESPVAHVLRAPAPTLCAQCHTPENMQSDRPEHKDMSADCLGCHSGHGGATHGLLRAGNSATTRPTVSTGSVDAGETTL
jgi:predicted CXXCH cytochrome family protein